MQQIATSETRHGKRKKGTTVVGIPMPNSLKEELAIIARNDDRTLAAWVRIQLKNIARRSNAARRGKSANKVIKQEARA